MENRPHSREKGSVSGEGNVFKRGDGLGTGKVGNGESGGGFDSGSGSGSGFGSGSGSGSGSGKRMGGGLTGIAVVIIMIVLILRGKGLGSLSGENSEDTGNNTYTEQGQNSTGTYTFGNSGSSGSAGNTYTDASSASVNTSVSDKARKKYTNLKGSGQDTVTVMMYMCGADLESKNGMATSDLNEMVSADLGNSNVNIIAETGGAKQWKNSVVSNKTLQRWKVVKGGLEPLDQNVGAARMTDPDTLSSFIRFAAEKYPADRYMLVLWDHGGGSVQGYGYDELYPTGTMAVDQISSALKAGGVKFDFVGFDACLMATMETALATEPYSDYLIASEETEPATGWYYTGWLNTLSANSSAPTTELGKQIIDDFTVHSASDYASSQTTLSLTDLAEFKGTVPAGLTSFGTGLSKEIKSDQYQLVADARQQSREFAKSSRIDQVDLVNFCDNLKTTESKNLSDAVKGCIKYNRASNMTNAYGMSIYFPYSSLRSMNSMVKIYNNLGMDTSYSDSVKSFATLESSGQITASSSGNGTGSLIDVLLGGGNSSSSSSSSGTDLSSLLMQALGGSSSSSGLFSSLGVTNGYDAGYPSGNTSDFSSILGGDSSWVDSSSLSSLSGFLGKNHVQGSSLTLTEKNGKKVLSLPEEQWKLIQAAELNVFVDDGKGYIDMGLDNTFDFDEEGNLIADYDGTWLALNGQPVAYYMTSDEKDSGTGKYTTEGYVPAKLNGTRVNILIRFTTDNPSGEVLGAQTVYEDNTLSKGLTEIKKGDTLDFLCDYYSYDGTFQDSYALGNSLIAASDGLNVSQIRLTNQNYLFGYRLTDIYNAHYWTPMTRK